MQKAETNNNNPYIKTLLFISWILFIFSLTFLVDVKITRYKLIGMQLTLISTAVIWLSSYRNSIKTIIQSKIAVPFLVVAIYTTVLYVVSDNKSVAFEQWQRMLFSVLAFITGYFMVPKEKRELIENILIYSSSLIALYAVLQNSGGIFIIQVPKMKRVFSTFGNPNFLASFLSGMIPIAVASLVKKRTLGKIISSGVMIYALYLTQTRGAWLGIIIALLFFIAVKGIKTIKKRYVVVIIAVIMIFGFLTRHNWLRKTERIMIWRDTIKMAVDNPVFGIGLSDFHNEFPAYASEDLLKILPQGQFIVNYAHNEFLEVFAESGIIGIGLYLWILVLFFATALKNKEIGITGTGAVLSVVALLAHSTVSVNMRFAVSSIWMFFIMGFCLNSLFIKTDELEIIGRFPLKKIIPIFIVAFLWSNTVIEPLVSRQKLNKEVDFFDSEKEYSKSELKKIISENPDNAIAYYKLGWIEAKEKDFENAISSFKRAVAIDDSLSGAYNNLGNIYYTIGKRQEAAKHYIEALKRNPSLTDAHFNLGYIYYYQGMLKEASHEFNIVLQQDPDNYKAKLMLKKMVQ